MDLIKVRGIVVKTSDYKDNDKLINMVTFELGRITVLARGVKKNTAKLKYAAEVFNFGEYMLAKKSNMYTMTECVQIDAFSSITQDIDTYYCGCMMMDVLNRLIKDTPQVGLLTESIKLLGELAYDGAKPNDISTKFLKLCLKYYGYEMDFKYCANCGQLLGNSAYFSENNGIICEECANKNTDIKINTIEYLQKGEGDDNIAKLSNSYLAYMLEVLLGVKSNAMYFEKITYGD